MKTKYFFATLIVALVCTGCTTYSYTSRTVDIDDNAKISTSDLIVDIRPDFTRRIAAKSDRHKSQQVAMNEAKYRAIVDNKVDVVVDPIYCVEFRGRKCTASLTGFAGFYENARTPMDELKALKDVSKETIEKKLMLDGNTIVLEGLYNKTITSDDNSQIIIYHKAKDGAKHVQVTEGPTTTTTTSDKTTRVKK